MVWYGMICFTFMSILYQQQCVLYQLVPAQLPSQWSSRPAFMSRLDRYRALRLGSKMEAKHNMQIKATQNLYISLTFLITLSFRYEKKNDIPSNLIHFVFISIYICIDILHRAKGRNPSPEVTGLAFLWYQREKERETWKQASWDSWIV